MKRPAPQDTSLFNTAQRARARRTDPITSFWAAQGVDCNRRQGMVLNALVAGPATQHELIDRVREIHGEQTPESTVRTGCSELEEMGLVESLGPIGRSPLGKPANVYQRVPSTRRSPLHGTSQTDAPQVELGVFPNDAERPAALLERGGSRSSGVAS